MNSVIDAILSRRSTRRFSSEEINEDDLNAIVQAGLYAPSAGGRQSVIIAICKDSSVNHSLGVINADSFRAHRQPQKGAVSEAQPSIADDSSIKSAFYNSPVVITLFSPENFTYCEMDCAVAAENIMLAAHSLGLGTCFIGRAEETFTTELGASVLKKWDIPTTHRAVCHIALGYSAPPISQYVKPRVENRVRNY